MADCKSNLDTAETTDGVSDTTSTMGDQSTDERKIPCIIVLGMAGAGKTSFVSRLVSTLYNIGKPYVVNLDPACKEVSYPANIGKNKFDMINYINLLYSVKYAIMIDILLSLLLSLSFALNRVIFSFRYKRHCKLQRSDETI